MSNDRPLGYDTLKLRAVFVPDGNRDTISRAGITAALGHDAVKIPAIFVPEGSQDPRPSYPYVHVGRYVWREDGGLDMAGSVPRGSWAAGHVQGTGDAGDAPPGQPATHRLPPALAQGQAPRYADPARTAASAWRAISALAPPTLPAVSHDANSQGETATQPDPGPRTTAGSSGIDPSAGNAPPSPSGRLGLYCNPQERGGGSNTQPIASPTIPAAISSTLQASALTGPAMPAAAVQIAANDSNAATDVSPGDHEVELAASADDPQGLKTAAAAARVGGLRTPEELEIFHDAITGRNITKFEDLVDIAKRIKQTGDY